MTAVDIREFLQARLAEDQALIERNTDGNGLDDGFPDYRTYDDSDTRAADEYIDRFGPARMLREIDAKRAILNSYITARVAADTATGTILAGATKLNLRAAERAARIVAGVYANHPDFDPAWSVTG